MKRFSKRIAVLSMLAMVFSTLQFSLSYGDGRLTEFKDTMSRIKRSGTGSATSGYTESNGAVRSNFVIVAGTNEQICIDSAGDGEDNANCTTGDDLIVDIVDDSALVSGNTYNGSELAEFISQALETALGAQDSDDSYTVTYNDSAVNKFVFAPGVNEDIYVSYDGVGAGDATLDLISDAGLTAHTAYTGAEVATALTTALNTLDLETGDDIYSVTYSTTTDMFTIQETNGGTNGIYFDWDAAESTAALYLGFTADDSLPGNGSVTSDVPADYINRFQIRGDGGNTLNPSILWSNANSNAYNVLGYSNAGDDTTLRDTVAVSDNQRQFNIIASTNDSFELDLDGESTDGTETITITAGNYTGSTLATQMDTDIDADWAAEGWAGTVAVTYSSEKFTITSDNSGTESYVHIESGTNDFLPVVDMVNDIPKDGQATNAIVSSDHTLSFKVSSAVPQSGYVEITFPSQFTLPTNLNYADIDFAYGDALTNLTEQTLAATNGAAQVGATVSGQVITFHLQTDEGITADWYVQIKIGRNTGGGPSGDTTGIEQIINPTIPGMYQIQAKTKTADTLTFTDATDEVMVWDPDGTNTFTFATATNEDIYWDPDGSGLPGDTTADLVADSSCAVDTEYTGSQVAACIKEALEATNGTADTYTVSYSTTTNKFTIQPLSGTTDVNFDWDNALSTAGRLLGFTADDTDLYTTGILTSDIVAGTYLVDIPDAANELTGGAQDIDVGTAYTGAQVAAALEEIFEDTTNYPRPSAQTHTYAVSYASNKFTIDETDVNDGDEPIFYWTWTESTAAYKLGFTADDTGLSDGFSLTSDINSTSKQIDTAYTAVYIVDNDQITITAGVDPNLAMEINGGLAYSNVEGDRDTLGVDFGALEPNAYYKLGGAKAEFVKITVNMNCGSGSNEACIPETNDTITIRGQNYTFKRVAADAATAPNYVYASITGTTQAQRAAKLLTNLYRAINSYDVNVRANIDRSSDTILWVMSTSEGPDATLQGSTAYNNEGGGNAELSITTYTESDGCGAYSYFYKDTDTTYDSDMSSYGTDLSGISDFRGHNIKINTNSADGYTLQIRDQGPDSTSPFITWSDSTDRGFGIYAYSQSSRWGNVGNTADGDDLVQESFQGGESNNVDPQGLTTEYQTLARNDVSTARDNISLEYDMRIDADQAAGNYQTTLELMLSAQF